MNVTPEELQNAGASPELARILADRWPRRAPGDLTRNPMAVALAGIALAAFLSTLGWLVLTTADTRTEVALLRVGLESVGARMTGLEVRMAALEDRMIRMEGKLDRLLEE